MANATFGQKDKSVLFIQRRALALKVCNSSKPDSVVILKGDVVVIPETLVPEMLDLLHEGHLGTTKME